MKTKKWLSLFVALAMAVSMTAVFAGCGEKTNDGDDAKITVTWYDGRTELKSEKIDKGAKATEWTPTKSGYEFKGWFEEASLSTAFDFSKTLSENTDIYSKWLDTSNVSEDTKSYYVIGTGSGTMKDSNWEHNPTAESLKLKKVSGQTNVYTVTLNMYAGDRFQICFGSWDGQIGIGYVEGAEYAAFAVGQNPYMTDQSGTAEDKDYAVVKNAAGEIVFHGGNENDNAFTNWNIVCNEGHDGTYTFTLHTYPGQESNNYIEWKLDKAITPLTKTNEMYIIGSMNGWASTDTSKLIAMSESDDKATWLGFVTITEDDYSGIYDDEGNQTGTNTFAEMKVFNAIGSGWFGGDDDTGAEVLSGGNIKLTAGTYGVKFTVATNKVEVQECKYYVVGTFLDGTNAVNFSVKKGVTPELTGSNGTYTVKVTATDVTTNTNYSWIKDQNKPGVFAIKVVLGCEFGVKDWFADDANKGDNFYLAAGEHTVTLKVENEGESNQKATVTVA